MENSGSTAQQKFKLAEFKKKHGLDKVDESQRQREAEWEKVYQAELFKFRTIENYVLDLTKTVSYGLKKSSTCTIAE